MPWYFPWSDSIKKRAVRYLIQHYMGHFLKEKISLDQLTVDLYTGTGTAKDISLDVAYINEALDTSGVPLELVDGYIGSITVSVPWSALINDNTVIEVNDLELTVRPKQRPDNGGKLLDSMLFQSMTTSMQLAEECLKQEPTEGELRANDVAQPFEGLELFAQTIEAVLSRIKVSLNKVTIRLEHIPKESVAGVAIEMHIARLDYFDDLASGQEWSAADHINQPQQTASSAFSVKNLHLTGVKIYCDEFRQEVRTISRQFTSESLCFDFSPPRSDGTSEAVSANQPVVINQPVTNIKPLSSPGDHTSPPRQPLAKESDLVLIAELTSRQEVKLRIKQNDELPGAKLELDCSMGCINMHLSPHLLHLLIEVANGLTSPGLNEEANVKRTATVNKPADIELERQLQKHLQQECHYDTDRERGYSESSEGTNTHLLDDSDDEIYLSLGARTDMDGSMSSMTSSQTSTATGSSSSTFTRKQPRKQQSNRAKTARARDVMHSIDDTSSEITRSKLKIAFLSIVILHEDPNGVSHDGQVPCAASSMDRLREMAEKYFDNVRRDVTIAGISTQAGLTQLRNSYSKACQLDHLGLLCKPVTVELTKHSGCAVQKLTADVTVGLFELVEAVFDQRPSTASLYGFHLPIENVLPEYCEILKFLDDERLMQKQPMYASLHSVSPCMRLNVKSYESTSRLMHKGSCMPKTEVEFVLTSCQSEVDITLADRIHALLNIPSVSSQQGNSVYQSLHYHAAAQSRQALFSEAINEDALSAERKLKIQLTCPLLDLHVRFPKLDLRHGVEKPWWKRSLHKEQLILKLDEAMFKTCLDNTSAITELELTCRSGRGLFKKHFDSDPVSFLSFCGGGNLSSEQEAGFDWPRLVVKSFAVKQSVLDDVMEKSSPPVDSLNGACEFGKSQPSPFSSRKVMYENEELVMPGDKRDIVEFLDKSITNTQLHIDCTFPTIHILLPDKDFLELVYNRLLNDLVLWEPMAPSPLSVQEPHSFISGSTWSPHLVAQLMHQGQTTETFSTCKSGARFDSSSESDEDDDNFYSVHETRYRQRVHNQEENVQLQSRICITLNIGKGRLLGCVPLQFQGDQKLGPHGRFLLEVEDGTLITVVGHNGDPDLQFLCVQLHRTQLHHNGCIEDDQMPTSVDFIADDRCAREHLKQTIYLSEDGICSRLRGKVGRGNDTEDMVTIAVRINNDTLRSVKKYLVAAGIRGATLRHRTVTSGLMWTQQIMEFFNVVDYDIPGYSIPKVLMELHTHLWSCAIDYRPLYLNYRALVTMETFSIASNILIDSSVSLLRFILDDGALYLSSKLHARNVDVKKNYVCVLDVGMFEISLRTSSCADARHPKMDIRASNNIIHIWTCSDSCYAMMEIINYLGKDGDLAGQSEGLQKHTSATPTPPSGGEQSVADSPKLSQRHLEQVHDMVADAMLESCAIAKDQNDLLVEQAPVNVYCYPADAANSDSLCSSSPHSSIAEEASDSRHSACILDSPDQFSDYEDFCIIDEPGLGISPKDGEPVIRVLTTEPISLVDNHFRMPVGKTDILKPPEHFPSPVYRYTLSEISVIWSMFGGQDFESVQPTGLAKGSPKTGHATRGDAGLCGNLSWRAAGGPGRDASTLMELQLNKIRVQHEVYPDIAVQASRQVLVINDIEIRDRLALSKINKFLYLYSSDAIPRQSHASMLVIKALHIRPDPSLPTQECMLRVSLQPLRLNIDQDALFFFRTFFTDIGNRFSSDVDMKSSSGTAMPNTAWQHGDSMSMGASPKHGSLDPVMVVDGEVVTGTHQLPSHPADPEEMLLMFSEIAEAASARNSDGSDAQESKENISSPLPVYFKSFVFTPEVPIRLDYQGKWVDMEQGTLAGLFVGLAQLNCSELRLKPINHRHGLLGIDRVIAFALSEWLQDIKKNQLPSLLGGVGPMYSLVQLVQGCKDLFWLPVEQYRRDGRIVRGIQRGAHSFMTCTAMSTLELTNRLVQTIQFAAEAAYDMVSPGPSVRTKRRASKRPRHIAHPSDLREGFSNAVTIVTGGLKDTATNIYAVAVQEHELKGVSGAVGGVLRQIPSAVIEPVIIATEATSNVLGGMRNQLLPDRKLEDEQKWKNVDSD